MKKNYIYLLLFPLLLTSCSKNKNAIKGMINADTIVNNVSSFDDAVIKIDADTVNYMIDTNMSFFLLLYSDHCSPCSYTKEYLTSYVAKTNLAVHAFSTDSTNEYGKLNVIYCR